MTVLEKILKLLEDCGVEFKTMDHEPVFTSEEAAKIRDSDPSTGAKALVMYADKDPVLLVVPGNKKVDFRKFKKLKGIKDLRMANPQEVTSLTTLEIGSIPPVGKVLGIKSFFDQSFEEMENVAFNAGSLTTSVFMKAKDLINIEKPEILNIVKD